MVGRTWGRQGTAWQHTTMAGQVEYVTDAVYCAPGCHQRPQARNTTLVQYCTHTKARATAQNKRVIPYHQIAADLCQVCMPPTVFLMTISVMVVSVVLGRNNTQGMSGQVCT